MNGQVSNLYAGTSGWSYNWKGFFYPEGTKSADYLKFYATRFNATEINSSFYHFTMEKTIMNWLSQTPQHFKFCPKLNREITHYKKLAEIDEPLALFINRYKVMGDRLGPILIQLPASFHFNPELIKDFFENLKVNYPGFSFALEARSKSWFSDDAADLFRKYNITFVIASLGKRFPYLEITTADKVYLRLHGDEKLYSSSYSQGQLLHYAGLTKQWLDGGKEVWIFFNNTMQDSAVNNS